MRRKKKLQSAKSSRSGMTQPMTSGSHRLTNSPVYLTPAASSSSRSLGSSIRAVLKLRLPLTSRVEGAADRLLADDDLGDLAAADGGLELAVRDLAARRRQEPGLGQRHEHEEAEDVPDGAAWSPGARERPPLAGTLVARVHVQEWEYEADTALTSTLHRLLTSERQSIVSHVDRTRSPSRNSPSSTRIASGSSTRRWIVRLSGRAPYIGS